jgi:NTE family protein
MSSANTKDCDLVMEGGGVKGLALVGALSVIEEHGYRIRRIAGSSAGAVIAALTVAGLTSSDLHQRMHHMDFRKFRDHSIRDRLGIFGRAHSLIFDKGVFEGRFLRKWLALQLSERGVETFADLKLTEPWAERLPPEQRYKLVVTAADITRGRLVRLPWDYHQYGLDPDKQSVAEAVRASMSIPFFFEPARIAGDYLVDGTILSDFPIEMFDNTAQWPTFGIKLWNWPENKMHENPVQSLVEFAEDLFATMVGAHDQMKLDDPCVSKRTIFVDTGDIRATRFDITTEEQTELYEAGRLGARKFFADWDFGHYLKACPLRIAPDGKSVSHRAAHRAG